jgi:orotidine-5'-phosphate decarboxylase
MLEAALEGASGLPFGAPRPLVFGITVLTSMEADDLSLYRERDPERLALDLAGLGRDVGLDGAICSGFEVPAIKALCGPDTLCLTPGIRLGAGAPGDDQRRVMTPAQAAAAGSDFLVAGRPITGAASPLEAARRMMDNLRGADGGGTA